MRVILPGGVRADWSLDEVAEAMRILTQALVSEAAGRQSRLVLADRFLRYADQSVKLTATERSIVRLVLSRESVDIEDLATAVWGHSADVSDGTIRTHCYNVSTKLFDASIPFALRCEGGSIYFEENLAVQKS